MVPRIPTSSAALLACSALACGPKPAATDTNPTATDTTATDATATATTTTATDTSSGPLTDPGEPTGEPTGDPPPVDACALVPDPGPCEAAFDRYYFDPVTRQCQVFTWGGCDGVVPFTDYAACQNACDPCDAFFAVTEPPPVFAPVDITIRNDTPAPIFLRTFTLNSAAFRNELFELWTGDGTGPLSTHPDTCDFACGTPGTYECEFYCSDAGPPPNPRMIIPGGALKTQWGGQHMAQVNVPTRCLPGECDSLECGRWLDATPGPYELRVHAAAAWKCSDPECCVPNADGWCDIGGDPYYAYPDPYTLELAVPFNFPGGPVELAFQ